MLLSQGLELDGLAQEWLIKGSFLSLLRRDELLYGIDEVIALGITNMYGTIGLTNFGYLDKMKMGIIGTLNNKKK